MKYCSNILVMIGMMFTLGCGSQHVAATIPVSATATLLPTSTLSPTATAFPTASPVSQVAGWQNDSSNHWVGYAFSQTSVTGVRAQWNVPSVQDTSVPKAEVDAWIGIGGWATTNENIIQVGTYQYFPQGGGENTGFWYEQVPAAPVYIPERIAPGDTIYADCEQVQTNPQMWHLFIIDAQNDNLKLDVIVQYTSLHTYPAFVVEDPDAVAAINGNDGPFAPFPKWSPITMRQIQLQTQSTWVSGASVYGFRIAMKRSGQTMATASSMDTTSSFTATQNG